MIKTNSLNKYFHKNKNNEIHVIDNTSLELPSTGLISFLGHSGSGKTTLLNVIGGLDKASGSISYDDYTIEKYNMHKMDVYRSKHIGYVFQNYNLLLEETVYDNLKIALEIIGVTDLEEIDKRVQYTLKAVGMYKYRKKKAYALSGGQQQRVSIARALVKNCKIIIADEPTGNLDSNNTIEVMNILKKISKNALVLMVTHERDIATFYSDSIYEIKDGKVISETQSSGDATLRHDNSSNIYLKDLNNKTENTSIGNIELYKDTDTDVKVDLKIIVKNGTIYLDSNQPIKLIKTSNINIINDHYKEIKQNDVTDFDYNTEWYQDKSSNKHLLKKFGISFINSILRFKNVKRRIKFIYFALFCIGLVCSISVISLINTGVNDSYFSYSSYNENYSAIYSKNTFSQRLDIERINLAYDEGVIDNVVTPVYESIRIRKQITAVKYVGYNEYTSRSISVLPYNSNTVELISGTAPKKNGEIVISSNYIDEIIASSDVALDYNDFLNLKVDLSGYDFTISGISTNDNCLAYVLSYDYYITCAKNMSNSFLSKGNRYYKDEIKEDGTKVYTVVKGRDVNDYQNEYSIEYPDRKICEILMNDKVFEESDYELGELIQYQSSSYIYQIVGTYTYPYPIGTDTVITNHTSNASVTFTPFMGSIYVDSSNYTITEGRDIEKNGEMIVRRSEIYKIGETHNGFKVVGYFSAGDDIREAKITTASDAGMSFLTVSTIFTVNDEQRAKEIFDNEDTGLYNTLEILEISYTEDNESMITIFRVLFISLASISALFIYFVMRSKMISDIYSIGVHRALGASRAKVSVKFLGDVLVLTTFTVLIGYIFGMLCYYGLASLVNQVFGSTALLMSTLYCILGVVGIYAVMTFFGMLPILMLLRKTPSQILVKYDI